MSEIFRIEDYQKLQEIFNLLSQSVALLQLKYPNYPDNYPPLYFEYKLDEFETEFLNQLDGIYEVGENGDLSEDVQRFGSICFKELDRISEAIYAYIDKKGCGRDMQILSNQNIF